MSLASTRVPTALPVAARARAVSPALRCMLGVLLLVGAAPTLARDYIVELVLFENLGAQAPGGGGYWVPKPLPAVTLGTERAASLGIVPSEAPLALADSAAAMTASGRYRILQHIVWQQPGLAARDAVRLRIGLGQVFELFVASENTSGGDFLAAAVAPRPDRPEPMRTSTIAGTVELSLGRFLHLDSKLVYTDIDTGRSYRLDESRKMRSRELHYIDNPRFGILTRIVPAEDSDAPLDPTLDAAPDASPDDSGQTRTEDGGEADDIVQN